jgi:pimeloyl-ACP methyl ester carboxylesterase
VSIGVDAVRLPGELSVPEDARAIVVFAHGSGSSRMSPRNVAVADHLNRVGLGTLLFDLLSPVEAEDRDLVFDVELLARRLEAAAEWLGRSPEFGALSIALFGASTGAAAALVAAARLRDRVAAVVSRGGRPDLAGEALARVDSPTLLVVGALDPVVRELNEAARRRLPGESRLEVIPGAGHLFEEPGALELVAELAASWITGHLS